MKELKCPRCQTTLDGSYVVDKVYGCPKCRSIGSIDLWNSLDIAVSALKWIAYDENDEQDGLEEFAISQMMEKADEALKQIIALKQKE